MFVNFGYFGILQIVVVKECFLGLCGLELNFSFFSSHKTKAQSVTRNRKLTFNGTFGFS